MTPLTETERARLLPPARRRGRPKRPAVVPEAIVGRKLIRAFQRQLQHLRQAYAHGNRELFFDAVVVAYLYAFFNPTVRSTRTLEDLSQSPGLPEQLGVQRLCRSTFSDATRLFDPELLRPWIQDLQRRVPALARQDPQLDHLLQRLVAADGSLFTLAADVAWALHHTKRNGQPMGQVRLNLQIRPVDWMPVALSVTGQACGSETAAMAELLAEGRIYVGDRNYLDFGFMSDVLAAGSDFVLRAKANAPHFQAEKSLPRSAKDREHGVIADQRGHLPGSRGAASAPPRGVLREVQILNPEKQEVIRLLTTLREAPAWAVGLLYRYRFQIELFFRWLKVWANFEHLLSESARGLTLQFYTAVIGVLLMHQRTGYRPSKYAYNLLTWVARGLARAEDILPILEKRERERQLERERLARKRAAKTKA